MTITTATNTLHRNGNLNRKTNRNVPRMNRILKTTMMSITVTMTMIGTGILSLGSRIIIRRAIGPRQPSARRTATRGITTDIGAPVTTVAITTVIIVDTMAVGAALRTSVIRIIRMDGIRIISIAILRINTRGAKEISAQTAAKQRVMILMADETDIILPQMSIYQVREILLTQPAAREENHTNRQSVMSGAKETDAMQRLNVIVRQNAAKDEARILA